MKLNKLNDIQKNIIQVSLTHLQEEWDSFLDAKTTDLAQGIINDIYKDRDYNNKEICLIYLSTGKWYQEFQDLGDECDVKNLLDECEKMIIILTK